MKKKIKQSYFFLGTYYCHYQMTIFTTIRHYNLPVICTKNHYDTLKYCQTYYEKTSYLSCVNSKQEPSAPIYSFRSSKNDQDMALYITCFCFCFFLKASDPRHFVLFREVVVYSPQEIASAIMMNIQQQTGTSNFNVFSKIQCTVAYILIKKKEPNLTESSDNCDRPTSVFLIS